MCEYCKKYDIGDGDGITSLKRKGVDFGLFGKGEIELEMDIQKECGIMTAWLTYDGGNENIGASVKIKFCPMCGRKLIETEE